MTLFVLFNFSAEFVRETFQASQGDVVGRMADRLLLFLINEAEKSREFPAGVFQLGLVGQFHRITSASFLYSFMTMRECLNRRCSFHVPVLHDFLLRLPRLSIELD